MSKGHAWLLAIMIDLGLWYLIIQLFTLIRNII